MTINDDKKIPVSRDINALSQFYPVCTACRPLVDPERTPCTSGAKRAEGGVQAAKEQA